MDEKELESPVCLLLVGSTGCGKSSAAGLLTGNKNIRVASRKIETAVYSTCSQYQVIDMQGFLDEEILESQKELYSLSADKLKILWFVHACSKAKPVLQSQARYIESFQNLNDACSVWDSVCVIVKKPGFDLDDAVQGALGAIKKVRSKGETSVNYTGYQCLDWLSKERQAKLQGKSKDFLEATNTMPADQITTHLNEMIETQLQSYKIGRHDSTEMNHFHPQSQSMDEKETESSVYVLLVGTSGCGKSSTARLLTGNDDIKVASRDDSERCTTETAVYSSSSSQYQVIDTQGAEDSESKETDEEILLKSQKELYNLRADKLKILWFVETCIKAKPVLQAQARYIESFQNGNDTCSVWDSVCVIVKQPSDNLDEAAQGALEAIKKVRTKGETSVNYTGYRCLDWLAKTEQAKLQRFPKEFLEYTNTMSADQITTHLNEMIETKLQSYKIFFRDSMCVKCGWQGDSRFGTPKCHPSMIRYHSEPAKPVHIGKKVKKHSMAKEMVKYHEDENKGRIHTRECIRRHDSTEFTLFHPQSQRTFKHFGHSENRQTTHIRTVSHEVCFKCKKRGTLRTHHITTEHFMGAFQRTCGRCGDWFRKYQKYEVCGSCSSEMCQGCTKTDTERVTSFDDHWIYSCCQQSTDSRGCAPFCDGCDQFGKNSQGCERKHQCCGKDEKAKDDGCVWEYPCCYENDPYNTKGCAYRCCRQKDKSQGCKEKLGERFNCCHETEEDQGCVEYYDCCENDTANPECGFRFKCNDQCNIEDKILTSKEKQDEINDESKGCQTQCQQCKQMKGEGPGCAETWNGESVEHEFISIKK